MRAPIHNVRNAHWVKAAPLVIPAALVPLVFTGFTAYPAAENLSAHVCLEEARAALDIYEEQQSELEAFGPFEEIQTLETLTSEIQRLLPMSLSDLEIFGAARIAARQTGVELATLRVVDTESLEIELAGRTVLSKTTRVDGQATLDSLVAWVDTLRTLGVPCAVERYTVSRRTPDEHRFRFEMTLGALHYGPPVSTP